jgi:GYF domain 2
MRAALFAQQYVTEDALVWAEGEEEWLPLKASHGLYSALAFPGVLKSHL